MAREGKGEKGKEGVSLTKKKRKGPTPLQELDPNVVNKKRRKEKIQSKPSYEDEKQMDGDEVMAVMQHRRAQ